MGENDDSQDKTHEPTEKKKQEFREKGQVPRSKEVNSAFGLALGSLILLVALPKIGNEFNQLIQIFFAHAHDGNLDLLTVHSLAGRVAQSMYAMMGLPLLLIWVTGAVVGLGQAQFVIPTEEVMKIQWDKLNPISQMKEQWFSSTPLVELGKSLLKLFLIAWLVWVALKDRLGTLPALMTQQPYQIMEVYYLLAVLLLSQALPVAFIIATADYIYQWFKTHEQMMMSREDLKDEQKQAEGDPHMRQARKQRQREIAMGQMLQNVPKADVVITNPTHYAIALRYRKSEAPAPLVVARGVDHLALRIKTEAIRSDVPQIENRQLARALYATSKVGHMIPEDLYAAVAKVLAVIWRRRRYHRRA